MINGQAVGFAGTFHPKVRCHVHSGGASREYVIVQVRGFSSTIASGTNIMIIVPDLKSCKTNDQNCYITISSAYTTNLDEPYILNYKKESVAMVARGSISNDVTVATDPNLSATFNNLQEICTVTTWTFAFTHSGTPISPATATIKPDHILVKFPRDRFIDNGYSIFSRTGATSNRGTAFVIDNYRTNEVYYFIIVNSAINAGSPTSFTLSNIRNPLEY